ncbi:MAG: PilZ domain-containing protein [Rhizobium altiplani]|jgi:hypothetical protein|uniref:PilZ domain-containing protein n=1 Tax=Rhizobium altiplani TaxID=1864509 RepID=UPI000DD910C7
MDGRKAHRRRTLIGAKILLNGGSSVLDCVVKDLSDGGARLVMDGAIAVPADFDLHLSDGRVFRSCRIAWRQVSSLGVSFSQSSANAA